MRKRTPLLLLPGLLCDAALWEPQVEELKDLVEARVPDLAAFDTIGGMAEHVLAGAPERFALAGLSMGGYVALIVLRMAPERVARIALLDTSSRGASARERERAFAECDLVRAGGFEDLRRGYLPKWIHPARLAEEGLVSELLAMMGRVGAEAFVRQRTAILTRPDMGAALSRIACPTLVLSGREDRVTPLGRSEEMAAAIPGAELVVVEECGHISTRERPAAVSAALRRWLLAD